MKQFDLEQEIMHCWNITSDLDHLFEELCEGEKMSNDRMANIVLGMKELYEIKFNRLFHSFESFLKEYYAYKNHSESFGREAENRKKG
jgi:hypothetical protein